MSLRINNNIAAANAHRNLQANDAKMGKTLERLSSGMKINRGADGPAALVISEQMRAQVAGLKQAVMNSENAVAMVQTAEASLNEVNGLLVGMRQLAIHAANEGANDQVMLEADQAELSNALMSIDRISDNAQYGTKTLLDGSHSVTGATAGENLTFIGATTASQSSPQSGYSVKVTQEATQATIKGTTALTPDMLDGGETLTFQEGGTTVQVTSKLGETVELFENRINQELKESGLKLDVYFEAGQLNAIHQDYGAEEGFSVTSSTAGVASQQADSPMWVQNGIDIQGTIGGEAAIGKGQVMTGSGGTNVEGVEVRFTGVADELSPEVGRVSIESNALTFQIGGNHNQITQVLIPSTHTSRMGIDVNNESGYDSLGDLDLRDSQGAQDAIQLIDSAIDQISSTRAELGAVQKNTLESNISSLNVAKENLLNSESVIRDTDMAEEMSEFTKNQIMTQSATAMLAQANQAPNNVLSLLK